MLSEMPRQWLAMMALCLGCSSQAPAPDGATAPDTAPSRSLDECFAGVTRPPSTFVDIQSYATQDGRYQVRRARQPGDRLSVGETFPYDLVRFGVSTGGRVSCIERPADLSYDFGHHNWNDTMEARTGEATYRVHEQFDVAASGERWKFTFTVLDATGRTVVEGPLPLTDTGCHTLPFDLNGCPGRMRTDR
jgi:hypothetical protein